jgi:hypothetical protein
MYAGNAEDGIEVKVMIVYFEGRVCLTLAPYNSLLQAHSIFAHASHLS